MESFKNVYKIKITNIFEKPIALHLRNESIKGIKVRNGNNYIVPGTTDAHPW